MLQELFEAIGHQAVKAAGLEITRIPGCDHRLLLKQPDGTMGDLEVPPTPRHHRALDLSAITEFALWSSEQSRRATIWYCRHGVLCVLDDSTRRDTVRLDLTFSPQLLCLQGLEQYRKPMDQRATILLLRTTFAKCLGRAGDLIEIIRGVKFTNNQAGAAVVGHGKSSVGRSIEQEITGTKALPEYVTLEVPVFTAAWLQVKFPVELALEPDPATQTFTLIPLPGEIENAIAAAEALISMRLHDGLDGAEVPVYYGVP